LRVIFYNSLGQKRAAKIAANLRGESTIHDDHIFQQLPTDGTTGTLTFDVKADPIARTRLGLNELNQRLKDRSLSYLDLLDLLEKQALKLNSTRWENFKALFGL